MDLAALSEVQFTCRLIEVFFLEQVAELIATCVSNLDLAKYKVLEAVAETTSPLRPIEDLLAEVPTVNQDGGQKIASKEIKEIPGFVRKNVKSSGQEEVRSLFFTLFM